MTCASPGGTILINGPVISGGDVAIYNDIALKVMKENGVAIDDLNAVITPTLAQHQNKADVHFNPEGSATLGKAVAKVISEAIGK